MVKRKAVSHLKVAIPKLIYESVLVSKTTHSNANVRVNVPLAGDKANEGEMTNYGTTTLPRTSVVPGMLVKYQGRTYRASANVGKGLYLFTLFERLRTTNDEIEVYLNQHGKPATH